MESSRVVAALVLAALCPRLASWVDRVAPLPVAEATNVFETDDSPAGVRSSGGRGTAAVAELSGRKVAIFSGIPEKYGWGEDLTYRAKKKVSGGRKIGSPWLGGLPLVDIWTEDGTGGEGRGVALFNLSPFHEPFEVDINVVERKKGKDTVTARASGGSNIVKFAHKGDYHEALREYANRMKELRGVSVQPAPRWAFDPVWETYGFEESWSRDKVIRMLPLLKEMGIGSITLDSGWYGTGTTRNWDSSTGDFPINSDVVGSERNFANFIDYLHDEGFKVRLWWCAGVAEKGTDLHREHPEWFLSKVIPSWGDKYDTGDWYLDPTLKGVRRWNIDVVNRFLDFGADGFKIDDIYEVADPRGYRPRLHEAYSELLRDVYTTAVARKPDFAINVCNCGVAQNIFHFPAENQLITSDPVGAVQYRRRAKYLHAVNVNGAAILGDHIELTKGDVGRADLRKASFYESVTDCDFASVVALGMVLETKFSQDPGELYKKWFRMYREYKFYEMEWVNLPWYPWSRLEEYALRSSGGDLYFSYFPKRSKKNKRRRFEGDVSFSHLEAGKRYTVFDVIRSTTLGSFAATRTTENFDVNINGCMVVRVRANQ